MIKILIIIYIIAVLTWTLYICSMQFKYHKEDLYPIAKFHAYIIVIAMLILDVLLNILVSPLFLEPPRYDKREWLLSPRLKRWNRERSGYRSRMAGWICEHFLNQFDRSGDHC